MQIKRYIWLLPFLSMNAIANLQIYPSKGLFGLDQSCQKTQILSATNTAISCDFVDAMTAEKKQELQSIFSQTLQQQFYQQVVQQIEQNTKHKTYVASLEVLRASKYVVQKQSTAEIFLPLTLSFKLTNILTGEVLYSTSITANQPIQVLADDMQSEKVHQEIIKTYQQTANSLVNDLVIKAKKDLQLSEIDTTVIDQWKSYLILDKGFNKGISQNDELSSIDGDLIRVVYADSDYAVAVPILISNHAKKFSKISTSIHQLHKPKALITDVATLGSESKDLIEQIFSDAVGDDAVFTLVPVNKRYTSLSKAVSEQTQLAQAEDIHHRDLPDFFIRLNVLPARTYQQSLGQITKEQTVHQEVFAEMLDRSGRVIHAVHASNFSKETISDGMGFSLENRKEIVLKNALKNLGQEFKKGIKFTRSDLQVASKNGNEIRILDEGSRLGLGLKIHVFHQEKVDGKNVVIPIWEATIVDRVQNQAIAQLDSALSPKDNVSVSKGDIVLINSTQQNLEDSIYSQSLCSFNETEKIGDIELTSFPIVTYYAFAENSKYPFYATGQALPGQMSFENSVNYLTQNAGFKQQLNFKPFKTKHCIQPVIKAKIKNEAQKCNGKACQVPLDITAGVRFFDENQKKIAAQGIQQEFNLISNNQTDTKDVYNLQLFEIITPLMKTVVQKANTAK